MGFNKVGCSALMSTVREITHTLLWKHVVRNAVADFHDFVWLSWG